MNIISYWPWKKSIIINDWFINLSFISSSITILLRHRCQIAHHLLRCCPAKRSSSIDPWISLLTASRRSPHRISARTYSQIEGLRNCRTAFCFGEYFPVEERRGLCRFLMNNYVLEDVINELRNEMLKDRATEFKARVSIDFN